MIMSSGQSLLHASSLITYEYILVRDAVDPEPIPGKLSMGWKYNLDGTVHHSAKNQNLYLLIFIFHF